VAIRPLPGSPCGSRISVSSFNTEARRFYERQGFAEVALLPDLIKPGFDEVLMRRRGDSG